MLVCSEGEPSLLAPQPSPPLSASSPLLLPVPFIPLLPGPMCRQVGRGPRHREMTAARAEPNVVDRLMSEGQDKVQKR